MENSDVPNFDSVPIAEAVNPLPPQQLHNDLATTSPHPTSGLQQSSDGYLPESDIEFQPFDPRNISSERIAGGIFTCIVGIAGFVGAVVLFFSVGFGWILYASITAATFLYAVLVYFTLFWPAVEHRHRQWRLTDVGLEVRHGVWWKHMQAIPWARVQHADVSQGPIQRAYGVGTLTVHTAGTSNSSVNLAGLSHEVAIGLRDEIIRQRASGDVV